jgi:hypothetical protein
MNFVFRICHCEGDSEVPLIAPCYCAGSLRYVHQACLQQWIKSSDIRSCELCKFQFIMQSKLKPFSEVNLYCEMKEQKMHGTPSCGWAMRNAVSRSHLYIYSIYILSVQSYYLVILGVSHFLNSVGLVLALFKHCFLL